MINEVATTDIEIEYLDTDVSASGYWNESYVKRPKNNWLTRRYKQAAVNSFAMGASPATANFDFWFWERSEASTRTSTEISIPNLENNYREITYFQLLKELNDYLDLSHGWDGPDSIPPTRKAVDDAIQLIQALPISFAPAIPMVAGDGEIGLYWESGDVYVELSFWGNGLITYFARDSKGEKYYGDDLPIYDKSFEREVAPIISYLSEFNE